MDLTYISEGNNKTSCYSFDLPAAVTCPGATTTCLSKCYALKLSRAYPAVGRKYARNLEFSDSMEFARYMIRNIPRNCEFRIHVSGDFYSKAYITKWRVIAEMRPDVKFYAYTRSWRNEELWFFIYRLSTLSNVTINLSCDKDTGVPTASYADNFRWCYLTDNDSAPDWLRVDDIVFRTNHSARIGHHQWKRNKAIKNGQDPDIVAPLIHRLGGAIVCVMERGKDLPAHVTCSTCRLCIKKPEVKACS